jgi:hypothetical protein
MLKGPSKCFVRQLAGCSVLLWCTAAGGHDYFEIQVVDDQTGRGVPLVELRTVNEIRYYTDSQGIVAFDEPGLMDQRVFFYVSSHGYEFPKDGFGFHGRALDMKRGGRATLKIKRLNIAERLYRVTGAGIYRDSVLTGRQPPIRGPLLSAQVLGSDSVLNAVYRGRLFWVWGDTQRAAYPLGNFQVTAATSLLPGHGGLDPQVGVDLTYFVGPEGFAKQIAPMPGSGPTWIDSLITLTDESGKERLFASYVKVKPPLTVYARGLAEFNDETEQFEHVAEFDMKAPITPGGHALLHTEDGVPYIYFARPYPLVRVRATAEDLRSLDSYEAFACLKAGSTLEKPQLDREDGRLRYSWKRGAPAVGPEEQARLIRSGAIAAEEALLQLRDRETGQPVTAHNGSVSWNAYRRRWVMITVQSGGTSFLGEVWYAEAENLTGPWRDAVKVVTHDRYSFYNPKHHPQFDQEDGRIIFFEGTYTRTFSGNPEPTPRYDYNQIMYKLDLADPRLGLGE